MNKLRWLAILMGIAGLLITGFQVYWLLDNYRREKNAVEARSHSLFRETVRDMQDSVLQLKLQEVLKDSSATDEMKRKRGERPFRKSSPDAPQMARVLNILGQKMMSDSAKLNAEIEGKPIIGISKTSGGDSNLKTFLRPSTIFFNNQKGERISINIDSLFNDSIPVEHLANKFANALSAQKLDIPFTIVRQPQNIPSEPYFIRRPPLPGAGYKLQLGNTFSYLIKKMTWPILFSFFLVGLAILSFDLLYRNLLRQHRLAQMKNDLISNITHELKTPIATVGVAIEALRNFGVAQSPDKTKEYLDISASELHRLSLLVDKVLKISMLEHKKSELKKESVDVGELVQEVLNIMKLQFEKHHARVHVNTTGDNFVIEADRLHITSVVYNLLDNALKYSQDNPVIDVQLSSLPNHIIELKVRDNGIGISKEYQAKIFDKFFRVPTNNTHTIKGYGLGLSYVKEILIAHMGFISVESEPGKGSTFSVKLPLEVPVL